VRLSDIRFFTVLAGLLIASVLTSGWTSNEHPATNVAAAPSKALILDASEGERRLHRPPPGALSNLTAPFMLKVDRRNGGAPEFVMLAEDIPPGQGISPHRHPHSDEIIFIHRGTGLASLAGRQATVTTGATIYMPRNTVVGLRNAGTEPLKIVAIFPNPAMKNTLERFQCQKARRLRRSALRSLPQSGRVITILRSMKNHDQLQTRSRSSAYDADAPTVRICET
jgi:quercetin dioxygenase-like cupin family protein